MKANVNYSSRFRILKGGKVSLVVSALLGSVTLSFAAPSGGVVTSGTANISQSGNTTNINQSTQKASINWNKFNIASHETVNFNQPNVNSITLNRVIGNERSIIDGALNANGQVWILNSNGVLFGKNASINTSGLLATTKDISDTNFQKGNYSFTGDSTESVINQGTIKVKNNGYVIFASNEAKNSGTIEAIKGRVQLTGADEYTINLNGNSLIDLSVDKGTLDALVENSGTILADGGEVYLTTHAVDELLRGVVNNTGIIEANSLDGINGHVELYAHGGTANIAGTIKAKGGFVETSGKELSVASTTLVEASKWLLDPTNMTIESTGGTSLTGASVSATAIESNLATTDIELKADNDITVNEDITWGEATKLTLTAGNEIYVNAIIENTNATNGGVYFNAVNRNAAIKFDATTGKVIINNINQLQWITQALNGRYELGSNIDASDTRNWNSDGSGGYYGFKQLGDNSTDNIDTRFTGVFDGKGYVIDGLYINRGGEDYVGLFGYTNGTTISNVGLTNVDITGRDLVGGLVGGEASSTITNSYVTGNVSGDTRVGGLVGVNYASIITNSYAAGDVSGDYYVGGLVGGDDSSTITNSYSIATVTGNGSVGGLVGGIVGFNEYSTIINSYWDIDTTGEINGAGTGNSAGATGIYSSTNTKNAFSKDTYAGFDFTNDWIIYEGHTRPLLRAFMTELTVKANDATRTYDGTTYNGSAGVTYSNPTYDNSLVNGTLSYSGTDLKNAGTATINVDGLYSSQQGYIINYDTGTLTTNKKDITVTGNSNTTTYDGTVQNTSGFTANGLVSGETVAVLDGVTGDSVSGKNAGTYNTNLSGTDENYNITFVDGSLDINKRALTLEAKKDYDGTDDLTDFVSFGNLVGAETLEYTQAKANSSNPIANNFIKEITLQDGENGGLASNYELPSLLAYSANNSVQIGDIPVVKTTIPDLSTIVSTIVNKTVLTNKDIETLLKSGIDIKTILQQLDTNELALIPGIVMKVLNGGINLPYGSKQEFNLENNNNDDNDKKKES
ncbi:filamentous hemagglutinin family outer membrane protein [Arcobacter nitrofigilis DSM 7299]|uniref:Filamentous hemagglutinin family outer membrane protein n=1 Tax=Arcobacter nitrofigilis (strain ATCC 33309 / DSM 7299 / CCUG 15893 / LMG 7604 / NCTC 12251 / CI) TaxID=572480 RepID=D5V0C2_ARCNC|nr:filamentous hemagglutinin N-terminal domain-containing protein [Arcobacter nitrofigilis]ADG93734.1 filamentous hemagglutinin family outer membrane protein [Arcobacter nitrofigilis DSM 7299]